MPVAKASRLPTRLVWVVAFVLITVVGFGYIWVQSGGSLFGLGQNNYRFVFHTKDLKNLENRGDVRIAGVDVGNVVSRTTTPNKGARVVVRLKSDAAPLHEGATVRVGMKSVIGMSQVDIVDGAGAALPSGTTLPSKSVQPAVSIDEVIETFDPHTRKDLSGMIRSLGAATDGTHKDLDRLMSGLGNLGRDGKTALDAIAAQSEDLQAMTREATALLDALDTGRGRIATVVQDAQRLTQATSGQRKAIRSSMRELPGLLTKAQSATGKFGELAGSLAPIAANLKRAAPDLNRALVQLPAVTRDLRGLLPALNGTLDSAPATLDRVEPALGSDLRAVIPQVQGVLGDVNPMLRYLEPYGTDIASFFPNFFGSFDLLMNNGVRAVRLAPIFDHQSVRNLPTPLLDTLDPTTWQNPYPGPGQADSPQPFSGKYPRVNGN